MAVMVRREDDRAILVEVGQPVEPSLRMRDHSHEPPHRTLDDQHSRHPSRQAP
jgi:hypothetical protein